MRPIENFHKTLSELKKYLSEPIENDRDRAGIIQAFEFTFEQSWKSIQKIATYHGVTIGNPKHAFSYALTNQWIPSKDEQKWLGLIKDRNLTTHTYHVDLAEEVVERVQHRYVHMFESLLNELQKEVDANS